MQWYANLYIKDKLNTTALLATDVFFSSEK